MNTLYIIGNGFDLAHGLKTSYTDFLLWYIKQCVHKKANAKEYNDGLIKLTGPRYYNGFEDYKNIPDIFDTIKAVGINLEFQRGFIQKIFSGLVTYNWVDIEEEYYNSLQEVIEFQSSDIQEIKLLNNQFELLKKQLNIYLLSINNTFTLNANIKKHFKNEVINAVDKILVVNFNYTSTIDSYIENIPKVKLINIHGRLNDPKIPLIFGYSNTRNDDYNRIHTKHIEFQKYIKLFLYAGNNNYKQIIDFINETYYKVKILGHSCGLSDGDLLGQIFMHGNCKKIEICFYEKSDEENDFLEKTRIISKHFPANKQSEVIEKIVTMDKSTPLAPYNNSKVALF